MGSLGRGECAPASISQGHAFARRQVCRQADDLHNGFCYVHLRSETVVALTPSRDDHRRPRRALMLVRSEDSPAVESIAALGSREASMAV
jgi:hypothetical protein